MTGMTGDIYTNFNVTLCDEKCNFFHFFSTHEVMQQQHDILSEYLGLKVCFYTLFFVRILGLKVCFYTIFNNTQEWEIQNKNLHALTYGCVKFLSL